MKDGSGMFADCYSKDGAPLKCYKCGNTEQKEIIRSVIDVFYGQGPVSEVETFCASCDTSIAYWAYGSFDFGYVEMAQKELKR